jgi:hypothetical protein
MESVSEMDEIVRRWQRATARADEEQVSIIDVDGEYRATSSSVPLGSYRLRKTDRGWACTCIANEEHLLPCKHLAALAEVLNLDVLADMRVEVPAVSQEALSAA